MEAVETTKKRRKSSDGSRQHQQPKPKEAAVLEAPSEERPKKHKKRKRASSEAQDAVKQPASKAAEATSFNEAIPVLDQESAEVPPGLGTPKKKKKRKREAAIEEPSPAQLPEPTSLSLPDEIQDDASVKKKRKKPKHRPDAVESDIVQHTWSASAIMPAPATLSLPTSHNQTEPASSALLGVNEDGLRVKKKRKKSKLSSNAGPTEQACQTVQPSVALLMPAAPALHQESREALAELEKPKKKKRTREATSNESLPKEDSEAASNPPPDNAQDDTPVKKRKKSKPRSHASQTEQPRQTAGASAALPGPAAPPLPAAPPKKAQKATLPVQPSKPPVKRLTRPPCSPSFLDELEAIAAAPKDPSAVSGRPVDIGDFFKFELQPPRVKKKPANTAHKVKNPALLPAAAPVNEDSFATARRELLLHGRSSTADTAKKAQLLGFVLQRGNFSLAEDETIKETIATISASRGITEAEFITMVRNVPRGPLRNDEAGHAVKEWRSLVVAKLDRPAKSVANRVRIMFDETGRLGSLTTEEHLRLLDLVAEHGRQWQLIGGLMGRSAIYLRQAWIRRTETPNKSTGRWAQDEVSRLWLAYDCYAGVERQPWKTIAQAVGTRDSTQCRLYISVHPRQQDEWDWTKAETIAFIEAIKASGATDRSEVKFVDMLGIPLLAKYTARQLGKRFNLLKKRYLKSHTEPRKFKTLLKGLLKEARQMDDVPRKRQKKRTVEEIAAVKQDKGDSSNFKSAVIVSTSDEEEQDGEA